MIKAKKIKIVQQEGIKQYTLVFQRELKERIFRVNNEYLIGKNSFNEKNIECFLIKNEDSEYIYLKQADFYINKTGYIIIKTDAKEFSFHSMVVFSWGDKNGNFYNAGMEIDHNNGKKFDNRPGNLEIVFSSQNLARAYINEYKTSKNFLFEKLNSFSSEKEMSEFKKEISNDRKYYEKYNLMKKFDSFLSFLENWKKE